MIKVCINPKCEEVAHNIDKKETKCRNCNAKLVEINEKTYNARFKYSNYQMDYSTGEPYKIVSLEKIAKKFSKLSTKLLRADHDNTDGTFYEDEKDELKEYLPKEVCQELFGTAFVWNEHGVCINPEKLLNVPKKKNAKKPAVKKDKEVKPITPLHCSVIRGDDQDKVCYTCGKCKSSNIAFTGAATEIERYNVSKSMAHITYAHPCYKCKTPNKFGMDVNIPVWAQEKAEEELETITCIGCGEAEVSKGAYCPTCKEENLNKLHKIVKKESPAIAPAKKKKLVPCSKCKHKIEEGKQCASCELKKKERAEIGATDDDYVVKCECGHIHLSSHRTSCKLPGGLSSNCCPKCTNPAFNYIGEVDEVNYAALIEPAKEKQEAGESVEKIGKDRTDRQRIKRKAERWGENFSKLPQYEQEAIIAEIKKHYNL